MKNLLHNLLICLSHIACVIFIEALLAVTIIWFSDYRYSLNAVLFLCLILVLSLHYCLLVFRWKNGTLTGSTLNILLCFDSFACVTSCLAWIGFSIFFVRMPHIQITFSIVINAVILLFRIIAVAYLRNMNQH